MKLAVAVLSSILLACSVTIANPVDPSATTDTGASTSSFIPSATTSTEDNTFTGIPTVFKGVEYNFWIDANPDGIGLGALDDALPDLEILKFEAQKGNGNPKNGEFQKAKLDHEKQLSKLDKIRKSFHDCQFKIGLLVQKKSETDKKIASLVFGTTADIVTVIHQAFLIRETPSVEDYIEKQLSKYKDLDQKSDGRRKHRKSGGRRKRKDFESSDKESDEKPDEESGYKFNRKGTFSMRRASPKFVTRFGSFFQRSKNDDPSN